MNIFKNIFVLSFIFSLMATVCAHAEVNHHSETRTAVSENNSACNEAISNVQKYVTPRCVSDKNERGEPLNVSYGSCYNCHAEPKRDYAEECSANVDWDCESLM